MSKKTKAILMVVCVSLGALYLLGASPTVPARLKPGQEPSGATALEGGSVLVEAFVVEVNLPALAKLGVSPIGQPPHAVTVADVLKCLDTGQARVVDGGKIAAQTRARASAQAKRTTYIRREKGASEVSYSPYESGGQITVVVEPVSETSVSIEFAFSSARFVQSDRAADVPPNTESWQWSGSIVLDRGVPQIAAASQSRESAVFLLLTANARR
jgi:hypothetical protein